MKKLLTLVFSVAIVATLGFGLTKAASIDIASASGRVNVVSEPGSGNILELSHGYPNVWTKSLQLPELNFTNVNSNTVVFQARNTNEGSGAGCGARACDVDTVYGFSVNLSSINGEPQVVADDLAHQITVIVSEDISGDGIITDDEILYSGDLYSLAYSTPGSGWRGLVVNPGFVYNVSVEMVSGGPNEMVGSFNYNLELSEVAVQ